MARRALGVIAGIAAVTLAVSGCAGGGASNEEDKPLTVWVGMATPLTPNFNPFSPTRLSGTAGLVYEPLFLYNKTSEEPPVPILGDSFEFNEDGRELTITIKDRVTWSDGEPFTVDDVVFTYNYEPNVTDPETAPTSVEAVDDTTVKLTFANPAFTRAANILQTVMLAEHLWKDVGDYATYTNLEPVGTGPYVVETANASSYTFVANENFRDEGVPDVKKVQYLGIDSNQTAQDLLTSGRLDWAGMFIPNPDDVTAGGIQAQMNVRLNPAVVHMCSNADLGCAGPQTDVAVRQALNLAIDRSVITDKAFVGLAGPISPTYGVMPRDEQWLTNPDLEESPQTADVAGAQAILEDAGYVKGPDGIYAKDGVPVEMSLISVDGWTDFNDTSRLIAEQAAAVGIKIDASTVQFPEFSESRQTGEYELIMDGLISTLVADPYMVYNDFLSSGATKPVGEQLNPGDFNYARYSNPDVDAAIRAAEATDDYDAKFAAYEVIQEAIARDMPYLPIALNASQTFTNTRDYTGWPTEDDLYMFPPPYESLSAGYILQQVERK